eukprot:3019472-Prymnesium_polylepis.1
MHHSPSMHNFCDWFSLGHALIVLHLLALLTPVVEFLLLERLRVDRRQHRLRRRLLAVGLARPLRAGAV